MRGDVPESWKVRMPDPENLVFRLESDAEYTHRRAPLDAFWTSSAPITHPGTAPLEVVRFENELRQATRDVLQCQNTQYELDPMTQLKSKSKVENQKAENL